MSVKNGTTFEGLLHGLILLAVDQKVIPLTE